MTKPIIKTQTFYRLIKKKKVLQKLKRKFKTKCDIKKKMNINNSWIMKNNKKK